MNIYVLKNLEGFSVTYNLPEKCSIVSHHSDKGDLYAVVADLRPRGQYYLHVEWQTPIKHYPTEGEVLPAIATEEFLDVNLQDSDSWAECHKDLFNFFRDNWDTVLEGCPMLSGSVRNIQADLLGKLAQISDDLDRSWDALIPHPIF